MRQRRKRPSLTGNHRKSFKYLITGLFLLVVIHAYDYVYRPEILRPNIPRDEIILTQDRITHILDGDFTGGGHLYGTGRACKSEFPQSWDSEQILETTRRIAANDNADWRQEENGYFVTEEMVEGVNVRVVLGPEKRSVITSYPINQPRNPCPSKSPANDN
ncbi:MAG: EndoU domain-containing protein [Alphaproteobacteria bacterium]|nr:EndoU domain-containing protein [Alphaproteobacteria bacterium]